MFIPNPVSSSIVGMLIELVVSPQDIQRRVATSVDLFLTGCLNSALERIHQLLQPKFRQPMNWTSTGRPTDAQAKTKPLIWRDN